MSRASHRVDVVIPTYNGRQYLDGCLRALRRQTFGDFAILVVDDGSTDGTVEFVGERYPEARVVRLPRNSGLARACNVGVAATSAEFVALLNNDTEPEPGWLGALVAALDAAPRAGSAASKLLLFDRRDTLHSAGDNVAVSGMPKNRGVWQVDRGQFDAARTVFGPCAGAALYRRHLLESVADPTGKPFDEDLFMYCEDVDLNWRALRSGFRCVFAPTARVYHRLSATGGGPLASYYTARNTLLVLAKNMPAALFWRYWPHIVAAQVGRASAAAAHWRGAAARATLRGLLVGLLLVPRFALKRKNGKWDRAAIERVDALLVHPGARKPSAT